MLSKKTSEAGMGTSQDEASEEEQHNNAVPPTRPQIRFVVIAAFYVMLILLSSTFLRIPLLIPTQWVSVVFFVLITPIFLYSLSVMVRPWLVITITFPSLAFSELLWCGVYGCGGELGVNLALAFSSWGIASLIISFLRTKNEIIAMVIGGFWTFLGLLLPATIYYALILNWNALYMVIYALLTMSQNLMLIPLALLLNYSLRKLLHIQYLDELLHLK
ncbi:MAG: hypothetical protein ACFFD8_10115 [Candidatus Thorarchaeota archaeon]